MIINNLSIFLVFSAGILSFFSPCIVPILPLYFGYLAADLDSDNKKKSKLVIRTISFVLGISMAFFLLGILFTNLGQFFGEYRTVLTRISGIIIILFGLIQIGFLKFPILQRNKNLTFLIRKFKMNSVSAFIMGFTFSFAWTPCVGPILSSVLLLASSSKNVMIGNLLVLVYTLGFTIPFLAMGLISTNIYNFLIKRGKILKGLSKFGGIVIILMGIIVYTGWLNNMSSYLSQYKGLDSIINQQVKNSKNTPFEDTNHSESVNTSNKGTKLTVPSTDFTLADQYGVTHSLSDYKGKTVFLNFWATGCPPCKEEIPYIEEMYLDYNKNQDDLIIISIVNPGGFLENNTTFIEAFIKEYGITYPVLFDDHGSVFSDYYINSLPTTFMINSEGEILGYVPGSMNKSMMSNIIKESMGK